MSVTENRNFWYDKAESWEIDFIEKYGVQFGLIINPSKENNKYAPDLYILKESKSADLKLLKIPFYKSIATFNIDPQNCFTFNVSDLMEYSIKYSNDFGIFIWKNFDNSNEFGININKEESIYYTTLFELKRLINSSNKIHHYIRRMNDTNGNSYGSYGVDLTKIRKIL